MELREDGTSRGCNFERMELREDVTSRGWNFERMELREDVTSKWSSSILDFDTRVRGFEFEVPSSNNRTSNYRKSNTRV
jgi:hypothetical protein